MLPDDSIFIRFNDFIKNIDLNDLITPVSFEKNRSTLILQSSGSTWKSKQIVHTEYNFNYDKRWLIRILFCIKKI